MAILKIRDNDGNVTEIPAIKGKSAYEYAKEGGFTGTEEEFATKLSTQYLTLDTLPKYDGGVE